MDPFSGTIQPPRPPNFDTNILSSTSSTFPSQQLPITPTNPAETSIQNQPLVNGKIARNFTSGRQCDRGPPPAGSPPPEDLNHVVDSSQSFLQQAQPGNENRSVATFAKPAQKFHDSGAVPVTHGRRPLGLAPPPSGAPLHTMGQAQFRPNVAEFIRDFRALCDNYETDQFDESLLLQMFNSMRGTSMEASNIMGNQPIDPINANNSVLIPPSEALRYGNIDVVIDDVAEVFVPNSTKTTTIEDKNCMDLGPVIVKAGAAKIQVPADHHSEARKLFQTEA